MSRVVHFEIPTTNIESSRKFYSNVFNWKIEKWEGPQEYWMINTGPDGTPGINGGFYPPGEEMSGTVNTIDVDNLDDVLAKIVANGGTVLMPKDHIPGVGWLAYAKDPNGAIFGMMQSDPGASM